MYYPEILTNDTEKQVFYLQSNVLVEHLRDKWFYDELLTAAFYIKKREKLFNQYSR